MIGEVNAVEYGLAASVYTRDVRSIFQFVDRVDVGIAHVNQPTLGGEVHLPFGGVKASGIGPHEQGREAIDFFTRKEISLPEVTTVKPEASAKVPLKFIQC